MKRSDSQTLAAYGAFSSRRNGAAGFLGLALLCSNKTKIPSWDTQEADQTFNLTREQRAERSIYKSLNLQFAALP